MKHIVKHSTVIADLIQFSGFKKVLEMGVWKSQTTRKILKQVHLDIDEYWAVDQWALLGQEHGRMSKRTQQNWDCMYHYACNLMTWFPPLRVLRLESKVAADLFNDKHFDLVYLDASHFYKDVSRDIKIWLPKVKDGGMLAGHDYITPRKVHQGVRKAVDEIFGAENIHAFEDGSSVWTHKL